MLYKCGNAFLFLSAVFPLASALNTFTNKFLRHFPVNRRMHFRFGASTPMPFHFIFGLKWFFVRARLFPFHCRRRPRCVCVFAFAFCRFRLNVKQLKAISFVATRKSWKWKIEQMYYDHATDCSSFIRILFYFFCCAFCFHFIQMLIWRFFSLRLL